MRIAITVPSLQREFGGPVVKASRLADELRALGAEVTLVGVGVRAGATGLPRLWAFHGTPMPARLRPLMEALRAADVVHVMGYRDPIGSLALSQAPHLRVLEPSGMFGRIVRSRRLKALFDAAVGRRLAARADAVMATSHLEAEDLLAAGVLQARVRVRPNGVDPVALDGRPRGALRERLGIPADAPLVLTLARINVIKRLTDVALALAQVQDAWALVAGPDDGDGSLEALVDVRDRLGLANRLRIIAGGLWGDDRLGALLDADVFCLPSEHENFGNAAAEAAAAGLPVVISDRCGVAEWLEHPACQTVPVGDVAALAEAIRLALTPEMATAARERAQGLSERLSWKSVAAAQLEIYRSLANAVPDRQTLRP